MHTQALFSQYPFHPSLHTLGILSDISLMASWFYLLSHVLFKSNILFQEFSLPWADGALIYALQAFQQKGLLVENARVCRSKSVFVQLSCVSDSLTGYSRLGQTLIPWEHSRCQPSDFWNWLWRRTYLFPLLLLGKLFPVKFKMLMVFI